MYSLVEVFQKAKLKHPAFAKRLEEATAFDHWPKAVGNLIARKTKPIRVLHNTLWIEVQDPIWRAELLYRKKQILESLASVAPHYPIQDLQFVSRFSQKRASLPPSRHTP